MSRALDIIVERVRLRAMRLALYMQALWADGLTSVDQGLSITAGEVRRRLVTATQARTARDEFYVEDTQALALAGPITDADAALAADPDWTRVIAQFGLDRSEADLLALAVALHTRPDFGRVYAYLADDVAAILPSVALVRAMMDDDEDDAGFSGAALLRWRLADVDAGAPIAALAGWRAAPAVARALVEGRWHDPQLVADAVTLQPRGWRDDLPRLQSDVAARAATRLNAGQSADLSGARGSGRRTIAAQLAADRAEALLMIDGALLAAATGDTGEALVAALRMARFEGALACVANAGAIAPEVWRRTSLAGVPLVRCFTPADTIEADAATISLMPMALAARLRLWRSLSEEAAPPTISAARVTAGEIARIARGGDRIEADDPVPDLLVRLPVPYDWDDLVLPPDTRTALIDFSHQVKLRGAVLEDWGFDKLSHLGSGLIALFAGPSGVGKTMATQVLARDLKLDLFRIDLAGVVDKYIGETEKRLREAFAFAELPGKLLMFDEADALFGTRTTAKDSHDRYANLEINYLLQRIETFEGIAVLATNRKSELDNAFRRRLRTMIDFLQPGPAERRRLWDIALPQKAPNGDIIACGIDRDLLADRLAMTGADIKAAALSAAFLARAEGSLIEMRHVLVATQREMAKHGATMRLPLAAAAA